MTKKANLLFTKLFLGILALPFVSAATFDIEKNRQYVQNAIDAVTSFIAPFFEKIIGDYSSSEFFFHKVLLFILLIIICKFVLDKTPFGENNGKITFFISLILSTLSIRFINENGFFQMIFIQYGVLGIAITTILPMVIFFYVIHNLKIGTFGRKVFWFMYLAILTGLWLSRPDIPEVGDWIYIATLAAIAISLVFDRSIHSYFGLGDFRRFVSSNKQDRLRELNREIHQLNKDHKDGLLPGPDNGKAYYNKKLHDLMETGKTISAEPD